MYLFPAGLWDEASGDGLSTVKSTAQFESIHTSKNVATALKRKHSSFFFSKMQNLKLLYLLTSRGLGLHLSSFGPIPLRVLSPNV